MGAATTGMQNIGNQLMTGSHQIKNNIQGIDCNEHARWIIPKYHIVFSSRRLGQLLITFKGQYFVCGEKFFTFLVDNVRLPLVDGM